MLHVYIKRILHTHMKTSFFELNPQKEFNEHTHTSAQKKINVVSTRRPTSSKTSSSR